MVKETSSSYTNKIIRSEFLSDSEWHAHEQLWTDEKEYHIFSGPEVIDAMAAEL